MSTKLSFESLEKRENPAIGSGLIGATTFDPANPFGPSNEFTMTDSYTVDADTGYYTFTKGSDIITVDPINCYWW